MSEDLDLRAMLEPHWFRIEARHWVTSDEYGDINGRYSDLSVIHCPVIKHTPKGAWIQQGFQAKRLILRDYQHRARAYAAPTLSQAKEDFRLRKQYRIQKLQSQIHRAEQELMLLDLDKLRIIL